MAHPKSGVASHDVVQGGTPDHEGGFACGGSVHHKRGGAVFKHGHVAHQDHVAKHLKMHDRFSLKGKK